MNHLEYQQRPVYIESLCTPTCLNFTKIIYFVETGNKFDLTTTLKELKKEHSIELIKNNFATGMK